MGLFSDYEIEELIAEGGMATLYRCRQTSLNRPVAVKVLSQRLMTQHPEIVEYFNNESLIIARLNHPNIVHVIDRGISGGLPYFVMEYVDGSSLDKLLAQNALNLERKLDIAVQISKALAYAHRNNVIHRDMKPANVLIDRDGNVQVADFGIARMMDARRGDNGPIMGTLDFMSPEQRGGKVALTPATDVYSFGVILYQMFTGQLPQSPLRLPSYYDPVIPSYLDELIARCLELDPAKRFPNGEAVKQRLLETMWGAHLKEPQKQKVLEGVGDITTRFAVLDVIAETPFGAVYLCENTVNHRKLVIKKALNSAKGLAESQQVMRLSHPHIAKIYGVSGDKRAFIIVSEYLPGGSLRDRLVNLWPWKDALRLARAIADALAVTHRLGIVHGNLRPSNILFAEDGAPKLTDYCLDEHYKDNAAEHNWYRYGSEAPGVTADIFALGVILYEMTLGNLPQWQRNELVINQRFRTLPFDLQDALRRMLAPVPKDRYRGFDEVIGVMDALLDFDRSKHVPRRKTRSWTLPALSLLFVGIAGFVYVYQPDLITDWLDRIFSLFARLK
jgi:serine/threonine-protein kinase